MSKLPEQSDSLDWQTVEVQDRASLVGDESPRLDRGGRRQETGNASGTAVVYGRQAEVNEGDQVKLGDVLVEWDPYTFAILTESAGTTQLKDLQEVVTLTKKWTEVTGLSRHVVAGLTGEKRQPAIVIKARPASASLMPSRAHLMVQDGDTVFRATCCEDPRRNHQNQGHHRCLPRCGRVVRKPQAARTAVISESTAWFDSGEVAKGSAQTLRGRPTMHGKEYSVPRGVHINVQEGDASRRANRHGRPAQPARHPCRTRRKGVAVLPGERNPGSSTGSKA